MSHIDQRTKDLIRRRNNRIQGSTVIINVILRMNGNNTDIDRYRVTPMDYIPTVDDELRIQIEGQFHEFLVIKRTLVVTDTKDYYEIQLDTDPDYNAVDLENIGFLLLGPALMAAKEAYEKA